MRIRRYLRHGNLRYLLMLMALTVVSIAFIVPHKVEIVQAQPYSGMMAHELQGHYYRGIFPGRDLTKKPY
ncbi:MAG TPA: hypothetical protein VHC90_10820 [Bryobacteraceae bacterium]|nr:hypothetical protein [Bryobacteraceae bacterium]